MVAFRARASGSTTATVGIAWSLVHSRRRAPDSSRARIPLTTTRTAAMPATSPKMPNFRRETGEFCSTGMRSLRCHGGFGVVLPVYHTENHGNKHQRRDGCKDQAADHRAPERRVLFAALAKPERHWRHADHHRQRRHQHRAETHEAGFDRGGNGVAEFLIAFAGERD